jgi:hypothetical protein
MRLLLLLLLLPASADALSLKIKSDGPKVRTDMGPPARVIGGLTSAAIDKVMKVSTSRFRRCFMRDRPHVVGRRANAVVRFEVAPDGTTRRGLVQSSQRVTAVSQCMAEAVKGLTFPTSTIATQVVYPIEFTHFPSKDPW